MEKFSHQEHNFVTGGGGIGKGGLNFGINDTVREMISDVRTTFKVERS